MFPCPHLCWPSERHLQGGGWYAYQWGVHKALLCALLCSKGDGKQRDLRLPWCHVTLLPDVSLPYPLPKIFNPLNLNYAFSWPRIMPS